MQYNEKINKLIHFGEIEITRRDFEKYKQFNFDLGDEEELISVAIDQEYLSSDDEILMYAPIHAISVLIGLKSKNGFGPVADLLLDWEDDDYISELVIDYMSHIKDGSFEDAQRILKSKDLFTSSMKITILNGLSNIAEKSNQFHSQITQIVVDSLEYEMEESSSFYGFVIMVLFYSGRLENFELMKKIFTTKDVDPFIIGDLEEIEMRLGLRSERSTPAPRLFPDLSNMFNDTFMKEPTTFKRDEPKNWSK